MSQDPVARSDALDATLSKNPVVANLVALSEQHSRIIKWLVRGAAIGAAVLVGVVYVAWQSHDAATSASTAASQSHVNCLAANQARATQRQLWGFILSFPPPATETAAARKQRLSETARFKKYVQTKFAPLNCSAVTPASIVGSGELPHPSPAPTTTHRSRSTVVGTTGAVQPTAPPPTTQPQPSRHRTSPSQQSSSPHPTAHPTPRPSPSPTPLLCVPRIKKCFFFGIRLLLW